MKTAAAVVLAAGLLSVPRGTEELTAKTFAQVQALIRPQAGESRWREPAWFVDLHAARQAAAAEGKPLFIYADKGATGIGGCSKAGRQAGRRPEFWTEETTRLIREKFVAVSLHNLEVDRSDAVGRFLRESGIKLTRLEASLWCVTAGGKILDSNLVVVEGKERFQWNVDVKAALAKWQALPEAERVPDVVEIGEMGALDTPRAGLTPPAGTLILKLHFRAFMRDGSKLRYLTADDLWYDEKGEKTAAKAKEILIQDQAHPDHLWLTEAEGRSLMPVDPRIGETFPMPPGIADRLVRWHLNPTVVGDGRNEPLDRGLIRAAELNLTVEAISAECVRMRLDGRARLGKEPAPDVAAGRTASINQWGYEPKLLGFLEFNPRKQVFTRFDAVAWGDHFGRLSPSSGARPGCQPLGITFELVQGHRPADRVPPGGASTGRPYFDPQR
jgi:hypothetical protein